ncbi:MAG: IPT/TIG domain-containing protein, partial [Acidobacteriaceae bacterium]|nr:IPT/TIG domain-containing protein [Acidobacteriaceae bacterium]
MGVSYKDTVIADNPQVYWRFEESAGATSTADYSPIGTHTGTIVNNGFIGFQEPPVLPADRANGISSSFFANSSSPQVIINAQDLAIGTGPLTVEWWVKPYSVTSYDNRVGIDWGPFLFHMEGGGGAYVGMQLGDRFTPGDIGHPFTSGSIYHIVFTYDGTNGKFYLNGALLASKAMSTPSSWNNGYQFGINPPASVDNWSAHFDELAVYNYALSPHQVANHYVTGSTVVLTSYYDNVNNDAPLIWYRMGDGAGTNISDSGSLNAPGTIQGGTSNFVFEVPALISDQGYGSAFNAGDAGDAFGLSASISAVGQYINTAASVPIGGSPPAAPMSVEWWLRPTGLPSGSELNNTIGKGLGYFYAGVSGSSGSGFCGFNVNDAFTATELGPSFFQLNQTAHYVFTYDGTFGKMYKNGRFIVSKPMAYPAAWGANGFAVGQGALWQGEYDEVAVYGTVLTDARIAAHYVAGLSTGTLPSAPTVVSVSSTLGNAVFTTGGNYVFVSGSGFQPGTQVYFSGVLATTSTASLDGNTIACYVPANPAGLANVSVLNPDGQSATGSLIVNYVTSSDPYFMRVIADRPSLYWRLNDGSGSYTLPPQVAADANDVLWYTFDQTNAPFTSSGNGSTMPLLQRTEAVGVSGTTGIYGGAVAFPGPDTSMNYIDTGPTGTTLHELTSNISVGFWVYMLDYGYNQGGGLGNYTALVGKTYRPDSLGWSAPFFSWNLQMLNDATGRLFGQMAVGGTSHNVETDFVMPLKQWVHVGFTFDGTTFNIYGNGANVGSFTPGGNIDYGSHGPYRVGGGYFSGSDTAHCLIDDLRIANVVRPPSYFSQFSGSGGPSLVFDYSNHGNTGSVYLGLPNLLWNQPGLVGQQLPGEAMTNIAGDPPVPFVSVTGDPNGINNPPAAGIGSGSFANAIYSFSAEWWFRRDLGPLLPPAGGIGTHRFGFAQGQFLYDVQDNSGRVIVGTDAGNAMTINNFVDPNYTYPTRPHHYVFTFSDAGNGTGTGIMYRDGIAIQQNTNMLTPSGWQAFEAIGPFSGTFDEVAVYPYALTQPQVYSHYAAGMPASANVVPALSSSNPLFTESQIAPIGAEDK